MKQIGPMQILLHIYSILRFNGPMAMPEIVEKLLLRGIKLDSNSIPKLHRLINTEPAARFGIRRMVSTQVFMIMPEAVTANIIKRPVEKMPLPVPQAAPQNKPKYESDDVAEMKSQIIDFCKKNNRAPSQLIESEKKMYIFILNHSKKDETFREAVAPYRGRQRGRHMTRKLADEIEVGMQLAESGGSGL